MTTIAVTAGIRRRESPSPARLLAAAVAIILALAGPASAQSRHAAMVIDANSGEVLHADRADEPRYPASLTKMMTLYMVFEQIELGRLSPSTKIKISQEAASAQPTKLDLEPGEQITVIDAIKALITKSANDMAIALAEAVGGSEAHFAELMTQKARALGMRGTTFRNASGLPDSGQLTTARDMLTLALHLQDDFPKYYPLFALRSFTYNGSTYRNHNTMLNSFEGIDGIKTGYTRMSGFNLVTSLRRGDKHLVGAVFGGTTAGTRNLNMRMLLTRALLKASTRKTRKPAPVLVARARPATRPAPAAAAVAAKPKPQQVAATVAAKPAEPAAAAAPPQTIAAAPPPVAQVAVIPVVAEAAPEPEPAPPIEVAKVRPVMVAPRVRRNAFIIQPQPTPEFDTQPAQFTPVATADRSQPAGDVAAQPERATANTSSPQVVAAPMPQPAAARGMPPSTFQAQAQSLDRTTPIAAAPLAPQQVAFASVAPARLRGPEPAAAPVPKAGGFHIQIGAFASVTEAERKLKETQSRTNGLLKSATLVTTPVQKENRLLYRARFAGFDAKGAANTCLELRRAAIDCFVMKAE